MIQLKNFFVMKSILVLGINGCIGSSIGSHFFSNGWMVFGYCREGYVRIVEDNGSMDIKFENVDHLTAHKVSVLVNALGGGGAHEEWLDTSGSKWKESYDSNVIIPLELAKKSLLHMRQINYGRIINIASVAASKPLSIGPEYAAAKAALIASTISLAKYLKSSGVTANCISPGLVSTKKVVASIKSSTSCDLSLDESFERYVCQNVFPSLTGVLTSTSQLIGMIEFLISDLGSNITGQNLVIDGGYTLS